MSDEEEGELVVGVEGELGKRVAAMKRIEQVERDLIATMMLIRGVEGEAMW